MFHLYKYYSSSKAVSYAGNGTCTTQKIPTEHTKTKRNPTTLNTG